MIATPLLHGRQVIGVLQLMSEQPNALDEIDVRTLQMVAGFAAAAFERASASARLQASERRTRAVIESAPYPIVLFDTDTGEIAEFNPAAEQGFGWAREDAVGRPATMLLPRRNVEAFSRWLSNGRQAGTQIYAGTSFETTGRRADGTEFPIEVAVADLPEETHLAGAFIRDVSLRQRLRESRERLASVVAGTPVILLACDMAGIITLSEGKGLSAFGLMPADTTGRSLHELLADEPDALGHLDRALRGDSFSGLIHLAGPDVFLEATYGPIKDGEDVITGVSAMLTDVSDRIHAEAARHESDAKSRLMAMMNHEVRTPLNSILGFATLLAESRAGALNEQQRHYIANIDSAGHQLLELVNESLDLAKLKAGHVPVELRELKAQQVIESAAGQVQPIADAAGVSLLVEPAVGVVLRADPAQLVQVLLNLLSNAIRHTPAGGRVTVSASNQADRAAIRVADNGQGIAREDLVHIFEEFYQARNHAPGGTGLGLTISRRLVEQMRGSIEVESELGAGSTFTVILGRGGAGQS
jgi:PAS domain S-box-containing protein